MDDLAYLQRNAFEFILNVNPGACCFTTPREETIYRDETEESVAEDWISFEQRDEAYRTGRFLSAQVYPCGSVSFYRFYGTSAEDVISACAKVCRDEQERWRNNGSEPFSPKPEPSP
ncbi:hypothetical protein FJ959_08705 [Mesorhizobium sp. B2-2-4]|uniref:hypothetical protein n=1 Tax=Mesorhizobium sp. B2-2-4 TaxID=2589962 RepID=UPI00112DDC6C|nr:hypothetical protein [Mesorhizobium sp. B2-2-4]TPM58946.1 hypothetical protein FJ959_08705 [Mesorhizobium sp. B2-2-4]